jgi:hypothetical protein
MSPLVPCRLRITAALAALTIAWLAGASLTHERAQAAAAASAAGPALRHGFLNNLDASKQKPNERGYVVITFKEPLPASPTIVLQCANPRYAAKVHDASRTGFAFAVYRTVDCLRGGGNNPFEGAAAAKPVTDFKPADNVDVAWVAIAGD